MDFLRSFMNAISPNEAEAKVIPKDQASTQSVNAIRNPAYSANNADSLNFHRTLWKAILNKADLDPKDVTVEYSKDLPMNRAGIFNEKESKIQLNSYIHPPIPSMLNDPAVLNTITHELIHFIASRDNKYELPVKAEHDIIKYILGSDIYSSDISNLRGFNLENHPIKSAKDSVAAGESSDRYPYSIGQFLKSILESTPFSEGVMQAEPIRSLDNKIPQ